MQFSDFEEKKVRGEVIFNGRIIRVERDEITLPNGKEAFREVVRHPGAVCVVPITDEGEVILVRQFRYPFREVLLEVPAGKLEAGERASEATIAEATLRELKEEVGVSCDRLTYMGALYPSVAIFDETIFMYIAEGLHFGKTSPDEDEFLEVVKIPLDELCEMIVRGDVPDAKTQAAVLKAAYILKKRGCLNEA